MNTKLITVTVSGVCCLSLLRVYACVSCSVSILFVYKYVHMPWSPGSIAGVPSGQALPGYLITAPPSVCVPAVLGALTVWIQNQKKEKKNVQVRVEAEPRFGEVEFSVRHQNWQKIIGIKSGPDFVPYLSHYSGGRICKSWFQKFKWLEITYWLFSVLLDSDCSIRGKSFLRTIVFDHSRLIRSNLICRRHVRMRCRWQTDPCA